MTPPGVVEAAILAVSIINVILMVWLGLTALLNAERPRWGVWLTGGVLLAGGAFVLAQAVVAERGLARSIHACSDQGPRSAIAGHKRRALMLPESRGRGRGRGNGRDW